mmetsp:Transcript_23198/g.30965  ORF Transcript_23198/g.30965 Transcript_23198/m.30965 type:complete len:195 (+) Transcript_23198:754-1338(+)
MQKSGHAKHTLFEMPDAQKRVWRGRILRLYAIYMPFMVGTPLLLEFGDLEALFAEKAEKMVMILTCADVYTVGMSFMFYMYMRKLVSKIEYNHETDIVTIRREYGSEFLTPKEHELSAKEIEKYKSKTFNKTIGYRSIKKGDFHIKFGTESKGVEWHDRKLFDSVISQPGERVKNIKTRKNWRASKKNKRVLVD